MESNNSTPASTRKRRSTTSAVLNVDNEPTPTKRRQTSAKRPKGKQEEEQNSRINLDDSEDPFDFGSHSEHHPEPLKNINIERSSFGELKFTKSLPSSADRYQNIERIAIGRNPQLCSTSAATPDNPTTLSMLSSGNIHLSPNEANSNKQSRKKIQQKNTANEDDEMDEFQIQIEIEDNKTPTPKRKKRSSAATTLQKRQTPENASKVHKTQQTPKSAQGRTNYWPTVTVNANKMQKDRELYKIPELSPNEQLDVDHPKDSNQLLQPGARVLALWGNEYYAAIVCGRESLGRYYIHFTEDGLNRILPPTGVIPISGLEQGIKISYIDVVDNEEVGKISEIIKQPEINADNPTNWVHGEFELRELDEDLNPVEMKTIHWQKLFLTKEQAMQIHHGKKSSPLKIDEENIINESRANRRSRSTRASHASGFGLETPIETNTPKKMGTPLTGRGRPRNTPKQSVTEKINSEENNKEQNNSQNNGEQIKNDTDLKNETNAEETGNDSKNTKSIQKMPTKTIPMNGTPEKHEEDNKSLKIGKMVPIGTKKTTKTNYSDSRSSADEPETDKNIFADLKFVLTSANRPNKKSEFNKREMRTKIEERGGIVIEDFSSLETDEATNFRLIADTFYRTHKYLCALSLSIPCVDYHWIEFCVEQNRLEKFEEYLLPAGESTIEPGKIFPWKSKKNLFLMKRVLVYSKYSDDPKVCAFGDIWSPIMKHLGATVIGMTSGEPFSKEASKMATMEEKMDFCSHDENKFDIFLADNDAEPELVECAERNFGALAVSSEWVIQAIVSGEIPDISASDRFKYDFV